MVKCHKITGFHGESSPQGFKNYILLGDLKCSSSKRIYMDSKVGDVVSYYKNENGEIVINRLFSKITYEREYRDLVKLKINYRTFDIK